MESSYLSKEEQENKSVNKHLVIGCGTTCKNHHGWLSIDINERVNPHIAKDIEKVTVRDIRDVNNGVNKFDLVFYEGIGSFVNEKRYKIGVALLNDQGALLISPMSPSIFNFMKDANGNYSERNFAGVILVLGSALIFKDIHALDNITQTMKADLPRDYNEKSEFFKVSDKIQELQKKERYADLDPLLLSAIAHLHAYLAGREQRIVKTPGKSKAYIENIQKIENAMISLMKDHSKQNEADVIDVIKGVEKALPSSKKPLYKLDYTPLNFMLKICEESTYLYSQTQQAADLKADKKPSPSY